VPVAEAEGFPPAGAARRARRIRFLAPELLRVLRLHLRTTLLDEAQVRRRAQRAGRAADSVVVTLSSIPSRIGGIVPALNSLLDQTVPPELILVCLPEHSVREGQGYRIPEAVKGHPRVRLLIADRDWGPATKLIPALHEYADAPDTRLLAVDDDHIYPPTFIESYLRWSDELPDAALSMRGTRVTPSLQWADCREVNGTSIAHPVPVDIVEGCAGILLRPRFLGEDFHALDSAPREAFFVDDIWTSGHLARRDVPTYLIPFAEGLIYVPVLSTLRGPHLHRDENGSGSNNDRMLEYFATDWRCR